MGIRGNASHRVADFDTTILTKWTTAMLAEGAAATTIRLSVGTARRISRHAGRSVLTIDVDDVRAFLAPYRNASTRFTYYRCAVRLFGWLHREGLRRDDPTRLIRAPRIPRGTPRPCSTIALYSKLDTAPARVAAMLMLGCYQGLRAHEIAKVAGEDFDIHEGTMRVEGKGGVVATLPLHPAVKTVAESMPALGWWFPSPRRDRAGQPITPEAVTAAVGGAHQLRHWFGTQLVRSGADLRVVQTLLRHSSLSTTAVYVEASDEDRRTAVLRLPVLGDIAP